MAIWIKRFLLAALVLVIVGGLVFALRPLPIPVDTAAVESGPMEVTVDEEGVTRIREVYMVSAPVAGKVLRSPREVGDKVIAGKTMVAIIQPGDPSFLDARTRRELRAAVAAATAAVSLADAQVLRAKSELVFAEAELNRAVQLRETQTISAQALEKARLDVETGKAAVASEQATLEFRRRELESAEARLMGPESVQAHPDDADDCCVRVTAPVDGRVLKIIHESEQRVGAGQPLLELGDPRDLEIVAELLSTDAVKIEEGAEAYIVNWGGGETLNARVTRVEPAGFEKVSALGIEEQRVNTILELTDSPAKWAQLGHDYRVFVRIVTWSSAEALQVPISALFRQGADWAVFVSNDNQAVLRVVQIGHRNTLVAEVVGGLEASERVVLHPSDRIADGVEVTEREDD